MPDQTPTTPPEVGATPAPAPAVSPEPTSSRQLPPDTDWKPKYDGLYGQYQKKTAELEGIKIELSDTKTKLQKAEAAIVDLQAQVTQLGGLKEQLEIERKTALDSKAKADRQDVLLKYPKVLDGGPALVEVLMSSTLDPTALEERARAIVESLGKSSGAPPAAPGPGASPPPATPVQQEEGLDYYLKVMREAYDKWLDAGLKRGIAEERTYEDAAAKVAKARSQKKQVKQ